MAPTSAHAGNVERERRYGSSQLLHPWRVSIDFCPSGRSFEVSKWIYFTYDLGSFHTVTSVLGRGVTLPFKSRIPVSYSPVLLLDVSPVGFQSQAFWELVSLPCRSQVLGWLMWSTNPLLLRKEAQFCLFVFGSLLIVGGCARGGGFGECVSLLSCPSPCGPFGLYCT